MHRPVARALIVLIAALPLTACAKDAPSSEASRSTSAGVPGTSGGSGAPTLSPVGGPAPTADTMEGLEMKGTLTFIIENGTVCPVVTDGATKRSLVLPSDWRFAENPSRVQDQDGVDVLREGQDVAKLSFSPAHPETTAAPCGGASEAVAVDGVTERQ